MVAVAANNTQLAPPPPLPVRGDEDLEASIVPSGAAVGLHEGLTELYQSGQFCDLALTAQSGVVGGETLMVHRTVLASVSPFLRDLLLNELRDAQPPVAIELQDVDIEALQLLVDGVCVVEEHLTSVCSALNSQIRNATQHLAYCKTSAVGRHLTQNSHVTCHTQACIQDG